jgi:molybdopterin converting factor small subunit
MAKTRTLLTRAPSGKSPDTSNITIEVLSWLKEDFNHKITDTVILKEPISPGTSIMELLRTLAERYPAFARKTFGHKDGLTEYCMVILNGEIISPLELDKKTLRQGDVIKLTPAFYGG